MNPDQTVVAPETSRQRAAWDNDEPRPASHLPAAMLLLGTVFWGASFTWSKYAGDAINVRTGLTSGSTFGPLVLLAVRFLVAGLLCAVLVPRSRHGWTWASAGRGAWLGFWVGFGMMLQSTGLDRTSEAVSAFLTALTVLFVPLFMTVGVKRPPARIFWIGVVIATAGVWMLTGATPAGFGTGEALSLACAVVFSIYIISVNLALPRDDPWRMTMATLLVCGVICLIASAVGPGGRALLDVSRLTNVFLQPDILFRTLLLTLLPTLVGYGLLTVFQPRVDPTRAALIYLMEPIFAAGYAFVEQGRTLEPIALLGAALIVLANALVELLANRSKGT